MSNSTRLGYTHLNLRGFEQNVGYDRIILEENQELIMSRDNDNKYDNNATVVKTVDGFIVGRVPKKINTILSGYDGHDWCVVNQPLCIIY